MPVDADTDPVSDEVLDYLKQRLAMTHWPVDAGNEDSYYGLDRRYPQELVEYRRTEYDWRASRSPTPARTAVIRPRRST